jgi:hypothetical protein
MDGQVFMCILYFSQSNIFVAAGEAMITTRPNIAMTTPFSAER